MRIACTVSRGRRKALAVLRSRQIPTGIRLRTRLASPLAALRNAPSVYSQQAPRSRAWGGAPPRAGAGCLAHGPAPDGRACAPNRPQVQRGSTGTPSADRSAQDPIGIGRPEEGWCRRPDSNRHGLLHTALNRARLPIPPLRQGAFRPRRNSSTCQSSLPASHPACRPQGRYSAGFPRALPAVFPRALPAAFPRVAGPAHRRPRAWRRLTPRPPRLARRP